MRAPSSTYGSSCTCRGSSGCYSVGPSSGSGRGSLAWPSWRGTSNGPRRSGSGHGRRSSVRPPIPSPRTTLGAPAPVQGVADAGHQGAQRAARAGGAVPPPFKRPRKPHLETVARPPAAGVAGRPAPRTGSPGTRRAEHRAGQVGTPEALATNASTMFLAFFGVAAPPAVPTRVHLRQTPPRRRGPRDLAPPPQDRRG